MSYQLILILFFRLLDKSLEVLWIPNLLNVNISCCAKNASWRFLCLFKSLAKKIKRNQNVEKHKDSNRKTRENRWESKLIFKVLKTISNHNCSYNIKIFGVSPPVWWPQLWLHQHIRLQYKKLQRNYNCNLECDLKTLRILIKHVKFEFTHCITTLKATKNGFPPLIAYLVFLLKHKNQVKYTRDNSFAQTIAMQTETQTHY